MKYILLVSHGMYAPGLHDALNMLLGGKREDILSTSLKNGMGADELAANVREILSVVKEDDELLVFADLIGGSPLTTTANVIAEMGLLEKTTMIGGMSLPLVLNAAMSKDDDEIAEQKAEWIEESRELMDEFTVELPDDDEGDDI